MGNYLNINLANNKINFRKQVASRYLISFLLIRQHIIRLFLFLRSIKLMRISEKYESRTKSALMFVYDNDEKVIKNYWVIKWFLKTVQSNLQIKDNFAKISDFMLYKSVVNLKKN